MELFDISAHKMVCSKGDFTANFETRQVNGQLVSNLKGARYHPKRGAEIFIKNIPRDALLQDILEFLIPCGDLYQIRLLMDFSGFNRGYCFATYLHLLSARKAVVTLNGSRIKSSLVVVKISFDNNKLEMRGVPPGINRNLILSTMSGIVGCGLRQVITFQNNPRNRNVCLLKYDTHRNAVEARKKVWPKILLWGEHIEVDWAIPHEVLKSKRLFFRYVPSGTTKLQLYEEVAKYIDPETMLNMFLQNELGYFLFTNISTAKEAFTKLCGVQICGRLLELSFSKFVPRFLEKE